MKVCKLRYYLNLRNVKLRDMAKELDIPAATISRYATGKMYPSVYIAIKIADYLGAEIGDIWLEI